MFFTCEPRATPWATPWAGMTDAFGVALLGWAIFFRPDGLNFEL
jgi:hypothetical protein